MTNLAINLLFICSRNQWRSPTAEAIFSKRPLINARSAGTSEKARRRVKGSDIKWADAILVMETKHRERLKAKFPSEMRYAECVVLEIEDEYQYMDEELIHELEGAVQSVLRNLGMEYLSATGGPRPPARAA